MATCFEDTDKELIYAVCCCRAVKDLTPEVNSYHPF